MSKPQLRRHRRVIVKGAVSVQPLAYQVEALERRTLLSICASPATATPDAGAASVTITVNGNDGPWVANASQNAAYQYGGDGSAAAPAVISSASGFDFTPGNALSIEYESGEVNIAPPGYPYTDANGDLLFLVNDGAAMPSSYFHASDYPAYGGELVGTFADSSGNIVGTPFNTTALPQFQK